MVVVVPAIAIHMTDIHQNTERSQDPNTNIRLWQLISPALPIGAYAYSQGLETAIENNWVNNESETQGWIEGVLKNSLSKLDAPVLARLYQAWQTDDLVSLNHWNQFLLASRESSELFHEDQQMGRALWRLLDDLLSEVSTDNNNGSQCSSSSDHYRALINQIDNPGYATVFSLAAVIWNIPIQDSIRGFLWAWCENQVAAGIKLVPLGQTAGQRILSILIPTINEGVVKALEMDDNDIASLAPGFSIACAQHETQYSRLFRS